MAAAHGQMGTISDSIAATLSQTRLMVGRLDSLAATASTIAGENRDVVRTTAQENLFVISAKLEHFLDQVSRRPLRMITRGIASAQRLLPHCIAGSVGVTPAMKFRLLHTGSWSPSEIREALTADQVEATLMAEPFDSRVDGLPTVLVLDPTARRAIPGPVLDSMRENGIGIVALGAPGEIDVPADLPVDLLGRIRSRSGSVAPAPGCFALRLPRNGCPAGGGPGAARFTTRTREVAELAEIGIKLTTEKNYNTLLDLILFQARRITQSDAGSLYLCEIDEDGKRRLRFKLTQNDSRPDIPFVEFTMPINHTSLAGYAAAEGEPLVFNDVYLLRRTWPTPSTAPSTRDTDTGPVDAGDSDAESPRRGNRRRAADQSQGRPGGPPRLTSRHRPLRAALQPPSGEAGAIDGRTGRRRPGNSQLYQEIERLFEGFVRAAVTAMNSGTRRRPAIPNG